MSERAPAANQQVKERTREETESPPLYRVLMHNDHYTTMDFVVSTLESVFSKPRGEAVRIMLNVHQNGVGMCGVYPFQIAETKVATVHERARQEGFPLRCSMEPE